MKALLIAVVLASSAFAVASNVQTAEYYQLDGWQGEYPTGYEILADVKVMAVESPNNPVSDGKVCTLKQKAVIHPWAIKTKSDFTTLSGISRYKASKDFEIFRTPASLQVKAGDTVLQLAYLSEGICILEANGLEAEDSCFGQGDDRAVLVSQSAFADRAFFKTACVEGFEAWVDANELQQRIDMDENPATVKHAEILDFGSVKEP